MFLQITLGNAFIKHFKHENYIYEEV